jgi:hypothetical protein
MDNGTSNSEALFSAPQCLTQRFDHVAHFIEYLNESVVCAAEKLCVADCIAGKDVGSRVATAHFVSRAAPAGSFLVETGSATQEQSI